MLLHRHVKKTFLTLTLVINLWISSAVYAQDTITIGILAFRPKPLVEQQWQPLIDYLNQTTPNEVRQGSMIRLKAFNYDELEKAINDKSIDFILTNSAHYVQLAHKIKISAPLATLINSENGHPLRAFAGTILVRNDQTHIKTLQDLDGKRIATPSLKSFGGYMMQAYQLHQTGINIPKNVTLVETKMPHDLAIDALIKQQVDAAFVRSGVLESMIQSHAIQANQLRVLNPQSHTDFPFLTSTRLYPEWPFAAMSNVNEALAGSITGALLALPLSGNIAQSTGIYGFSIAADYEPIREVMRTLRVEPFNQTPDFTIADIWRQHYWTISANLLAILTIILLSLTLFAKNKRLKQSHQALQANNTSLRIAAVSFDTQEATFITDKNSKIIKVNQAFSRLTGYSAAESLGQTPKILSSGKHDDDFYAALYNQIIKGGYWQGELWNRRKNGEIFPVRQTITVIRDETGEISHYVSTFNDITLQKENEERIRKLAFFDPLTNLANRRLLQDHLKQARAHSTRNNEYFALLFMDLDHFKTLNDTLGHDLGDELLKQVAIRLQNSVREGDTVARTGGDEFVLLIENLGENEQSAGLHVKHLAENILQQINKPYLLNDNEYLISGSIGISLFTDHHESVEEMMIRSDLAMYQAKSAGRNAIRFFDPSMQLAIQHRSQLENELRTAIQETQFLLYYQPQINKLDQTIGYEVLLRWQHPERGLLTPFDFLNIAEDSGLIVDIGYWIIAEACQQLAIWQKSTETQHLRLAVNISAKQLRKDNFVEKVIQTLIENPCNLECLEFEITESILMQNMETSVEKMNRLKTLGITFALDDFGTGYSSLSYLKNLPISWLKIDRSFVNDMLNDSEDMAIVKTILVLAQTLGLQTIAEGVETEAQKAYLLQLGCPVLQGYLCGKPAPLADNSAYLLQKVI